MSIFLNLLDKALYWFLKNGVGRMPSRFAKLIAYYYTDARIRRQYWESLGVRFGEGTYTNLGFKVVYSSLDNLKNLRIGRNVSIAPNVTIILDSEPNNSPLLSSNEYVRDRLKKYGKVTIEDDVWVGANVTIMPNVTLRKGSILGAGSVVLEDTDEFSTYAGVPARKIRTIGSNNKNSTTK